jgi:Potato inhibitor I family
VSSTLSKAEVVTMNVERADGAAVASSENEDSSQGPWPECVGKTGQECVTLIEELAPDVKGNVFIIPYGSMVTMDFRTNRVRVFVDEQGVVVKAPSRG